MKRAALITATILGLCVSPAAAQAEAPASLATARDAVRARHFEEAFNIYLELARAGDLEAQYQVGVFYRSGQGTSKSHDKAFYWFDKAAKGGHALSQYQLGTMYEHGWGTKRDESAAADWYGKAATKGIDKAATRLASLEGRIGSTTQAAGVLDLCRAAASSDASALAALLKNDLNINGADKSGRTALHCAAEQNNGDFIGRLLKHGANANAVDRDGNLPLHLALRMGNDAAASALLNATTHLNQQNKYGQSPLHLAAKRGDPQMTMALIKQGADLNLKDSKGRTALTLAKNKGEASLVELLSKNGAHDNDTNLNASVTALGDGGKGDLSATGLYNGWPALHIAAWQEGPAALATLKDLAEKADDVNQLDQAGYTALARATQRGNLPAMKLLLARGANPWAGQSAATTAIAAAFDKSDTTALEPLLAAPRARPSPTRLRDTLEIALKANRGPELDPLVEAYRDAIASDANLLRHAASGGSLALVKLAKAQSVDLNIEDSEGRTALFLAIQSGHQDIAQYLIKAGASVEARDTSNQSLLALAIASRQAHLVETLLVAGADPNAPSGKGSPPLCLAAATGDESILRSLLAQKARIDGRNETGSTALMIAAETDKARLVNVLLEAGANPNFKNDRGLRADELTQDDRIRAALAEARSNRSLLKDIF